MSDDIENQWSFPEDDPWAHLIEHSSDVITVLDEGGTILFISPAVERVLGYAPGELIGTTAFEHIHPSERDEVSETFSTLIDSSADTTTRIEYRFRHADGSWVWLETTGSNRTNADLGGYVFNSRDITEKKRWERRVSETTRLLESVLNNIESVVWMRDEESRFMLTNDKFRELFSIPEGVKIRGKRPEELVDQDTAAKFRTNDQEVIGAEEPVTFEEAIELGNERRHYLTEISPIYDEDRELFATCGVATDITDQKRRERELRERTKELLALHETTQLFATSSAPLNTLLDQLIDRVSEWFQFPEQTEVRITYGDIQVQTADFRASRVKIRSRASGGEDEHVAFHVAQTPTAPDDTHWQFLREEKQLVDTVTRLLAGTITRRSQQHTLELFKRAIDEVGHAVFITDREGIIAYVNPAFVAQTGYEEHDAIGKTPRILKSGHHDQTFYERLWETILSGEMWEAELINRRRDGSLYFADQAISPIMRDGEITHFVAIEAETTQRRIREQQLGVLNRLMRHNLRNCLTVIGGYASVISEQGTEQQILDSARSIRRQSDRLAEISEKNTRVIRVFERPVKQDASIDLTPVLQTLENSLVDQYPSAQIAFEYPETVPIAADASIVIALEELFENSVVHAMSDSPRVLVEVERLGQRSFVEISITDDGPGIPADQIEMLTEGTETPLVHGSGVGLWIVHWIMSRLGGELNIVTPDHGGTRILLRLPNA